MKKKIVCLLLALAVVMSVVPLTALADTMPEEFLGKYTGKLAPRFCNVKVDIFKDTNNRYGSGGGYFASIDIDEECFEHRWPLSYFNGNEVVFGSADTPDHLVIRQEGDRYYVEMRYLLADLYLEGYVNKNSDSTSSTLSTGSDLIIPIAAAVLLIGGVIFIGKRKKG